MNENNKIQKEYYDQDLANVWSYPEHYTSYEKANWKWGDFPFSNNLNGTDFYKIKIKSKLENISILEVGSAMGAAYNFLNNSNLIDLSNYTGIEVSKSGNEFCVNNYKKANWIHADFTKFNLSKKYDYSYERISVHHMAQPLVQYDKILSNTNIAASFSFRGCINGETISNINKACFFELDGKYYCNIINVFDVINVGLKNDFNDIRILFGGLHEPFIRDEEEAKKNRGNPYVSKEIDLESKHVSRFQVRLRKNKILKKPKIYVTGHPRTFIKYPLITLELINKIKKIKT